MTLSVGPISGAEHLAFVRAQRSVSFLQTPAWASVKTEWRSESVGWFDGSRLVGAGLVLHRAVPVPIPLPRLKHCTLAYLPEGPIIDWTGDIGAWLDPLVAHLKAHGAFAVRLGPPVRTDTWSAAQVKAGFADPRVTRLTELPGQPDLVGVRVTNLLRAAGWLSQNPADGFGAGHPQFKYEIPLVGRTEEDVLGGMNQLWRRNIKKAARAGVSVTVSGDVSIGDDLRAFHDLYVHTAARDHFTPRPLRYFETMFAAMRAEDPARISLYLARHETDLIAAAISLRVGTHACYAYGASSTAKREMRGSNACQWAMMRDALAAGCDVYDLRGITATLDVDEPHAGLIQFKAGAGGQAVRYVGEWDLALRPVLYRAFQMYMKRRG